MAKTREIACQFYQFEGSCSKGREGTFRKSCQKCNLYQPIRNGKPARPNLRQKKKKDAFNKDFKTSIKEIVQ